MKQVRAVSCKLQVTPEQVAKLNATLQAFANACNYINQVVDAKMSNNVRIQSLVYEDLRAKFYLSANLAIRAINRVASNRKIAKQKGKPVRSFKPTSVDYDARIFSLREKDWTVSLTLVGGRERFKLAIGNYQLGLLKGIRPISAILTKRQDGSFYLNIQLNSDPPNPCSSDTVLGVDLEPTEMAVTSAGTKGI